MLRRKLTKILVLVLSLALLMTALPVNGVLAAGETGSVNYNFDSSYVGGAVTVDGVIDESV